MEPAFFRRLKQTAAIAAFVMAAPAFAAVTTDEYGWTVITPSPDSRIIYVSSSEGSDANNGLSPETPKKSLSTAQDLARAGYPDHLLLKRGDTFTLASAGLNRWKNGRSADEPIVISYYGDSGPRPVVELDGYFVNHNGGVLRYQAFIGLDLYSPKSDPDSPKFTEMATPNAFRMVGSGGHLLVEDCRMRFTNVVFQSYGGGTYQDIKFRRNIVTDTWTHDSTSTGAHTTGIYFSGLEDYLVEENLFDHCGWSDQIPHANANMYGHNVYINYSNKAGGIFRGNISARSSAVGALLRAGGVAERNLFVLNAVGAHMGGASAPADPNVLTFDNVFRENVMINGRLMDPNDTDEPRSDVVGGLEVNFIGEVDVIDNILSNRRDSGDNTGFAIGEAPASMNLVGNSVYNWDPQLDTDDPSWPSPESDLGTFYDEVVGTDATGEAATIEYLNWLRERPVRTLPWEMTAYAAINYIREGFNKAPVEGYFDYATLSESMWADWPRDEEGYVNTGDWLGWLYVDGDWVYSYKTDGWMYLPESAVTPDGAWSYITR